jgi:8-amino-7-oxononanoate synthase
VSDALFSMDGDVADLPGLVELARRQDCLLILDEAHATGVLGSSGRGIVEHFAEQQGIPAGEDGVDLAMGTLSKALGSFGGFVACSGQMRELLINKARPFIFSTALPPSAVGAARAGLELIQREPPLLEALRKNSRLLARELSAQGFDLGESQSPILPVIFGQEASTLRLSEGLMSKGYFVPAIRPPSVPAGTSRLRITVTAAHSAEEIIALATTIGELARREFESAHFQGRGLVAD